MVKWFKSLNDYFKVALLSVLCWGSVWLCFSLPKPNVLAYIKMFTLLSC